MENPTICVSRRDRQKERRQPLLQNANHALPAVEICDLDARELAGSHWSGRWSGRRLAASITDSYYESLKGRKCRLFSLNRDVFHRR